MNAETLVREENVRADSLSSNADCSEAVDRLVHYFEHMTPASLAALGQHYAPAARFKDPFNDVCGVPAIESIFKHMFASLKEPRFVITERLVQGRQCFLTWEFHFAFEKYRPDQAQCIFGATHLKFADDGLVLLHRDYWDAAEELYEKLPLIGSLLRWIKPR